MEGMAEYPDKHFDLAIVDPPYQNKDAIGVRNGKNHLANRKDYHLFKNIKPEQKYFDELFRVSKHQIIWGSNYYPENLYHSGAIVWHKKTDGPLSDCELAFQSFDKKVKYVWAEWQGFLTGGEKVVKRIHPNQKPVKLYEWLLTNYAEKGQRILDTHLGSGSSAIAAHYFGCDFVGLEIDQDYFNAAQERFNNETRQEALF